MPFIHKSRDCGYKRSNVTRSNVPTLWAIFSQTALPGARWFSGGPYRGLSIRVSGQYTFQMSDRRGCPAFRHDVSPGGVKSVSAAGALPKLLKSRDTIDQISGLKDQFTDFFVGFFES